jgi:transposase InsO family protein
MQKRHSICSSKPKNPNTPRPHYACKKIVRNRTFRDEFYACRDLIADSIGAMMYELRKAVEKYNRFRPHYALKGKTPME